MGITGQTITQLVLSMNEKDVENSYRQYLTRKVSDMIFTSPFGCDGLGESKNSKIRVLCEFKDDLDLQSKNGQTKVLAQAVYYIKKFEISGTMLPTTVFLGDKNECFVIHANDLFKYLSMDLDWNVAPSNAYKNLDLVNEMLSDENINPHVFSINQIDDCLQKLKDLTTGVTRLIPITPHNITDVFSRFEKNVLGKHNLNTNQLANLFTQLLINPDDNYLHPIKKRKTIVTKSFNEVSVKSRESFTSFFSHFSRDYTPRQKEDLTAVVDRLIQDVTRRKQGEFFTPTIWVDKAHEYIASVYGDDWKEKYVVWDPAWGTGNLTRDYKFKELYVSTLNYSDIQTAEQMGYNPEAVKFQFDFLNDDYDFLPKGLRDAIESGRDIIVLMNPPYGKPTPNNSLLMENKSTTKGMTNTLVGNEMNVEKMGIAASQLYLQFIFKLQKIKSNICMFSTPGFLTQISNKNFRNKFLSEYSLVDGFIMDSGEFADIKSWGLTFSILKPIENENKHSFTYDILEKNKNFEIVKIGEKIIYNTDDKINLSEWMEESLPKNNITFPVLESALGVSNILKKGYSDAIGYINNDSNNVQQQNVIHLMSGVCKANGNKPITSKNFERMVVGFSARKVIKRFWIDDKDEFIKPNCDLEIFNNFKVDSVVYSLFHIHSFQTSMRNVEYNSELWDIKNEFFWMSKEEMMELANNSNYNELYSDARTDNNRYVHNLLFGEENIYEQLSPDAKLVLDKATELVRMSMTMRSHFADDNNHLNSWDAGYAQLKLVWKEYFPEEFKEFRQLYKNLEDRMRPLVYELGFLLK